MGQVADVFVQEGMGSQPVGQIGTSAADGELAPGVPMNRTSL